MKTEDAVGRESEMDSGLRLLARMMSTILRTATNMTSPVLMALHYTGAAAVHTTTLGVIQYCAQSGHELPLCLIPSKKTCLCSALGVERALEERCVTNVRAMV